VFLTGVSIDSGLIPAINRPIFFLSRLVGGRICRFCHDTWQRFDLTVPWFHPVRGRSTEPRTLDHVFNDTVMDVLDGTDIQSASRVVMRPIILIFPWIVSPAQWLLLLIAPIWATSPELGRTDVKIVRINLLAFQGSNFYFKMDSIRKSFCNKCIRQISLTGKERHEAVLLAVSGTWALPISWILWAFYEWHHSPKAVNLTAIKVFSGRSRIQPARFWPFPGRLQCLIFRRLGLWKKLHRTITWLSDRWPLKSFTSRPVSFGSLGFFNFEFYGSADHHWSQIITNLPWRE